MSKNMVRIAISLVVCGLFVFSGLSTAYRIGSKGLNDEYGVKVSCDGDTHRDAEPGSTTIFTVQIKNIGDLADSYDVDVGTDDWGVNFDVEMNDVNVGKQFIISLDSGESITLDVIVELSESATNERYAVHIWARSQNSSLTSAHIVLVLHVEGYPFIFEDTGTIEWESMEGGFWAIIGDNGVDYRGGHYTYYNFDDLIEERFQQPGLRVTFTAEVCPSQYHYQPGLHICRVEYMGKMKGRFCGYVYESDGETPLNKACVYIDACETPWVTDENGYYDTGHTQDEGGHSLIAGPPWYQNPPLYLTLFKYAHIHAEETCWVNFSLEEYKENSPENRPPENVQISGETSCTVGEEYEYTFSAKDPEGDQIYFLVWYGYGGSLSGGYHTANFQGKVKLLKTWGEKGDYIVYTYAIDKYGFRSKLTKLEVSVSKNKQLISLEPGIYVEDDKIEFFPITRTIIIGDTNIKVDAEGASKVEFYIDEELEETVTEKPYIWKWDEFSFGRRTLKVIAYDNAGNGDTDEMTVWKFF